MLYEVITGLTPAELWQQTQALYREPGVETLCLQAQDKAGADIT